MATHTLTLSEDAEEILLSIAAGMWLPDGMTTAEMLELTIERLVDSLDSQTLLVPDEDGQPLQLQEAIDAILSPDISTVFTQPDAQEPTTKYMLTLQEIKEKGGVNGKDIDDPIMQEAIVQVYNHLDREDWNTAMADSLVDKTYNMLLSQLHGRTLG